MKAFFMKALMWGTRLAGIWFLRVVAWFISSGYFFFRPKRVKASMDLYAAIFPDRSSLFYLWCAWKQFKNFSSCYCDRISLETGARVSSEEEGWEHIEEIHKKGSGGIILMSHVGSWEIAARLFRRRGLEMLLLMGERHPRQVARFQREDMKSEGLEVLVSSREEASPFAGLDAIQFMEKGGFVGMAGDLSWADGRRNEKVELFGREVFFPTAPHMVAMLAGAPVLTFFAFRKGRNKYLFIVNKPRFVKASSRADRKAAVRRSVQEYARELEEAVKLTPWQWYVFETIFEPKVNQA